MNSGSTDQAGGKAMEKVIDILNASGESLHYISILDVRKEGVELGKYQVSKLLKLAHSIGTGSEMSMALIVELISMSKVAISLKDIKKLISISVDMSPSKQRSSTVKSIKLMTQKLLGSSRSLFRDLELLSWVSSNMEFIGDGVQERFYEWAYCVIDDGINIDNEKLVIYAYRGLSTGKAKKHARRVSIDFHNASSEHERWVVLNAIVGDGNYRISRAMSNLVLGYLIVGDGGSSKRISDKIARSMRHMDIAPSDVADNVQLLMEQNGNVVSWQDELYFNFLVMSEDRKRVLANLAKTLSVEETTEMGSIIYKATQPSLYF